MTPTLTPPQAPQPPQSGLETLLHDLLLAIASLTSALANPAAAAAQLLSPTVLTAGSNNPTGPKFHAQADLLKRLHAAYGDVYGRVSTGDLVSAAAGSPIVTLTSAAKDYMVQVPANAKTALIRAEPPSGAAAPTNNIQAYWATGITCAPLNPNGLAYDAGASGGALSGYLGMPMRPSVEYIVQLSDKAAALHFASAVASTVIVAGFTT